jgi:hypothetical protein
MTLHLLRSDAPTHLQLVNVDAQNVVRLPVRPWPSNVSGPPARAAVRSDLARMVLEHPGFGAAA